MHFALEGKPAKQALTGRPAEGRTLHMDVKPDAQHPLKTGGSQEFTGQEGL